MNGVNRFFRAITSGWMIAFIAIAVFAYACFTLLAPWQLGKNQDLAARNSQLSQSIEAAPVPLAELTNRDGPLDQSEWHRVTATGQYLPQAEVLLRQRAVEGRAVYQVFAAFRTDEGTDIFVNRGWVLVGENNTVPHYPAAPTGRETITARLRMPSAEPANPIVLHGQHMVDNINTSAMGPLIGLELEPHYLQLPGGQAGSLEPVPVPSIEQGSYLSYGLQWLAFGVLAPIGFGYFLRSDLKERRRARDNEHGAEGDLDQVPGSSTDHDGDPMTGVAGGSLEKDTSTEDGSHQRLTELTVRNRYGTRFEAERRRSLRHSSRLDF